MKKYCIDLLVNSVEALSKLHFLIRLTDSTPLPDMLPGQFVEVKVENSPKTLLRRPISINYVDKEHNELWLLVAAIGDGTRALSRLQRGDKLNCMFPLGNSFTLPKNKKDRFLLVGGGVGIAPLLFLGKKIKEIGGTPTFLLGARTAEGLIELDHFKALGNLYLTTEDGSAGDKGFVTDHSILRTSRFDHIATCGPKPMMTAIARFAKEQGIDCEVSLENKMACGIGACLCCVEKTTDEGNICVCKEGPVLNIKKLLWQL